MYVLYTAQNMQAATKLCSYYTRANAFSWARAVFRETGQRSFCIVYPDGQREYLAF